MILHQFVRRAFCAAVVAAMFSQATVSLAVGIYDYQVERSFSLPAPGTGSGGNVLFDALPDGRLLVLNGASVSVETAPKSGAFSAVGNVGGFAPAFGASFMTVSPDGTRAAVGSNAGSVLVFSTSNPATVTSYAMADFSGTWIDNQYLAVANFAGSAGVQVLNTASSSITSVISGIDGFSAGVAFDAAGNLFTGNGTGSAPGSETGWIKAFPAAAWQNALATSTPLNFETTGVPIADLLTAYPIDFDTTGNMFVGGGEVFSPTGDKGYAALIDAAAIASALAAPQALPPITAASPAGVLRKFTSPPDAIAGAQPPNWIYNKATGELHLNYAYGDGNVTVYSVPEPAAAVLMVFAAISLVSRRARRA